jgi:hypothetical protein
MKREEDFKTVITVNDAISAQMVAGMLIENGIPAAVFGSDSTAMLNGVGNIDVKVNAADYDAAIELINTPAEDIEDEGLEEGEEET